MWMGCVMMTNNATTLATNHSFRDAKGLGAIFDSWYTSGQPHILQSLQYLANTIVGDTVSADDIALAAAAVLSTYRPRSTRYAITTLNWHIDQKKKLDKKSDKDQERGQSSMFETDDDSEIPYEQIRDTLVNGRLLASRILEESRKVKMSGVGMPPWVDTKN